MNCERIEPLLDALLDGALSDEDRHALNAHCEACAVCAEKLHDVQIMKRLFDDMAPEIDVPLQTQASWRRAVKAEAAAKKRARLFKLSGGIAAALVVALTATFALREKPARLELAAAVPEAAMETEEVAMIEADGRSSRSLNAAAPLAMPMNELHMTVEALDKACDYMADLVSEYEGEMDVQRTEENGRPCANLYITLPAANVQEFLDAAAHYDVNGSALAAQFSDGDTAAMVLILKEG